MKKNLNGRPPETPPIENRTPRHESPRPALRSVGSRPGGVLPSQLKPKRRVRRRLVRRIVLSAFLVVAIGLGVLLYPVLSAMIAAMSSGVGTVSPTPVPTYDADATPEATATIDPDPTVVDKEGNQRDLRVPITAVVQKDPEVENLLLIGVDRRKTDAVVGGNGDTMMIISIDRRNRTMKLVSVLRDCYVEIAMPDGTRKKAKINAAYSYGGPGLTINTLNRTFDLDIQKYVLVDFLSSEAVVDAAGGVMVDIREEEVKHVNAEVWELNNHVFPDTTQSPYLEAAGLQKLNGRQAVCYARIRRIGMDFARVERQKNVIRGLMERFFEIGLFAKVNLMTRCFDMVETNLSLAEVYDLVRFGSDNLTKDTGAIEGYTVPASGTYVIVEKPIWVFSVDLNKAIPAMQEFIWGRTFKFEEREILTP